MKDSALFEQLQHILLSDQRETTQHLEKQVREAETVVQQLTAELAVAKKSVAKLKDNINDPEKLATSIAPAIDIHVTDIKKNFHDLFGSEIDVAVKTGISNSKDEFIETLYPIMGKLIQRYIKYQFDTFLEDVNQRVDKAFSFERWINNVKSFFTGVKKGDLIVRNAVGSKLEEVFVIHRESGLLIGSYSKSNTADVDMVAGMLTAIRSFVENAFNHNQEQDEQDGLKIIQYGSNFNIIINDFHKYYVASVVSGNVDARTKVTLNNTLTTFSDKHMPKAIPVVDDELFDQVSKKLEENFETFTLHQH